MRKIVIVVGLALSLFATPLLTAAQSSSCPRITQTLVRGSSGTQVIALQQYFIRLGYLDEDSASGYFGPLTEAAVQRFQRERNIVSSGTPATTGYGAVGPTTRGILSNCGESAPITIGELPAQQAGNLASITDKTSFYKHLYRCALNRDPQAAELTAWSTVGVSSHLQVFESFLASPEYVAMNTNNSAYVDKLYQCILFRASELPGNAYWLNELSRGVTRSAILNNVLASSEYASVVAPRIATAIGVSAIGATATAPLTEQQAASCAAGTTLVNGQCVTTPVNTLQATCSFNGSTMTSGASVTAYQSSSVANGQTCVSQVRTCTNGTLSGSYAYGTCIVQNTNTSTTYWVRPDSASNVCKYFANTDRYDIIGTRDFKHCISAGPSNQACVTTPFYWMPSATWALAENRSDYLPADGIVQQIRCGATGAHTTASTVAEFSISSPEKYQVFKPGASIYLNWTAKNVPVGLAQVTLESGANTVSLGRSSPSSAAYLTIPATFPVGNATLKISIPKDARFPVESAVHSIPVVISGGTTASAGTCTTPWQATIASGAKVTAYLTSYVPAGGTCVSEQRSCTNGTLSGSYYYKDCSTGEIAGGLQAKNVTFSAPAGGETFAKGSDSIPVRFNGGFGAVQFENVNTGAIYSGAGLFAATDNKMDIPFDVPPGRYRLILRTVLYDGSSNVFTIAPATDKSLWVKPGSEVNACKFFAGVDRYDLLSTRDARGAEKVDPKFIIMWSATTGGYESRSSFLPTDGILKQISCRASGSLPYIAPPPTLSVSQPSGQSYAKWYDPAITVRFSVQNPPARSSWSAYVESENGTKYTDSRTILFDTNGKLLGSSVTPDVDSRIPVPNVPPGTYRVVVQDGNNSNSSAKSPPFTITTAVDKPIWVKSGQEVNVCRIVAGVDRYNVVSTRDGRCTGSRCVSPAYFWATGSSVILEDRPEYLPTDGMLKQIKCSATGTTASAISPENSEGQTAQLANILSALQSLLGAIQGN